MFSICKKRDKELALEVILMIQTLIKVGVGMNNPRALDLAEKFAEDYTTIEHKINFHDYTRDDEIDEAWHKRYVYKFINENSI